MAHTLARRALARSPLARLAPCMSVGLSQFSGGVSMQSRQKSSHAENTNHFIVEVRDSRAGV